MLGRLPQYIFEKVGVVFNLDEILLEFKFVPLQSRKFTAAEFSAFIFSFKTEF